MRLKGYVGRRRNDHPAGTIPIHATAEERKATGSTSRGLQGVLPQLFSPMHFYALPCATKHTPPG